MAGRSVAIRARKIAEHVYKRPPDQGDDPMAVVRVDAGRLRRRLDDYYAASGKNAALRIHIDPGGYAPRFEWIGEDHPTGDAPTKPRVVLSRPAYVAAVSGWGVLAVVLLSLVVLRLTGGAGAVAVDPATGRSADIREALFAASPAKLQAVNLAEQARGIMFPPLDRQRLESVLSMFEQSMDLDPTYHGGHAGAAQVQAMLAMTSPSASYREDTLANAATDAARAVDLAPAEGWSHSALALVAMGNRQYGQALDISERARTLSPEDPHVLEFDALIALFSGEFERALAASEPPDHSQRADHRFSHRNVSAAANYHLGDDRETIRLFTEAARAGDPISAISMSYLIAAHHNLGDHDAAEAMLSLLNRAWPGFPVDALFFRLFKDQTLATAVIAPLTDAGWRPRAP